MIVILEGPDDIGKTTLIEHLDKKFQNLGFVTFKFSHGGPDENGLLGERKLLPFNYFYNSLMAIQTGINSGIISGQIPIVFVDRFFQSNRVYGKFFDNQPILQPYELYQLIFKLNQFGWMPINITIDNEYSKYILNRRKGDFDEIGIGTDINMYNRLLDCYRNIYKVLINHSVAGISIENITLNRNMYEQGNERFTGIVNVIANAYPIMASCKYDKIFDKRYESTGSFSSPIAFVGEKVNKENNRGYVDPFLGGCGKNLFNAMVRYDLLLDKRIKLSNNVYMTNAVKTDGSIITQDELKNKKIIVCFGKIASKTILSMEFKNKIIMDLNHPAYVKRFEYNNFYNYYSYAFDKVIDSLKELMKEDGYKFTEFKERIDLDGA